MRGKWRNSLCKIVNLKMHLDQMLGKNSFVCTHTHRLSHPPKHMQTHTHTRGGNFILFSGQLSPAFSQPGLAANSIPFLIQKRANLIDPNPGRSYGYVHIAMSHSLELRPYVPYLLINSCVANLPGQAWRLAQLLLR